MIIVLATLRVDFLHPYNPLGLAGGLDLNRYQLVNTIENLDPFGLLNPTFQLKVTHPW